MGERLKRERCEYCRRVIYLTDYQRGLAQYKERCQDTLGGPRIVDFVAHTYDCEGASRRLLAPPPSSEKR